MEISTAPNYADLYDSFKRHKQYLDNVSPATVEGYDWAWKALAPVLTNTTALTKQDDRGADDHPALFLPGQRRDGLQSLHAQGRLRRRQRQLQVDAV